MDLRGFEYYFYSRDPMVGNITCAVVISTLVAITICFCCVFIRIADDEEPVPLGDIYLGRRNRPTRHRRHASTRHEGQTVVISGRPQIEMNYVWRYGYLSFYELWGTWLINLICDMFSVIGVKRQSHYKSSSFGLRNEPFQ